MKAVLMERGRLWVDSIDPPEPGKDEVIVSTKACGICGSDLHAHQHTDDFVKASLASSGAFRLTTFEPVVLGHEFCAEIEDYGPGTTERPLPVGQLVCSVPALLRDKKMFPIGYSPDVPGGFAEQMVLSARWLLPVPDGVSPATAALTEPMAVALHAVEKAEPNPDTPTIVIGAGPVGLAVLLQLKARGVAPIIVSEPSQERAELARTLGADDVVHPDTLWETSLLEPGAATLTFECVGMPGVLGDLYTNVAPNSRIIVVGVCLQPDTVHHLAAVNKELNVQYVLGYSGGEFKRSLQDIADGTIAAGELVTGEVGLAATPEMFTTLGSDKSHCKVVVEPWR